MGSFSRKKEGNMKRIFISMLIVISAVIPAWGKVLILEGGYYIEDVEIIANRSGDIVFKHGDEYYQLNTKYVLRAEDQAPASYSPLDTKKLSLYKKSVAPFSRAAGPSEETVAVGEDKIGAAEPASGDAPEELPKLDLTETEADPHTLQPLKPGKTVKLYFHNGKSVKGLLKSWGEEEIILQGKDGDYVVEISDVSGAKYYLSPDDLGAAGIIAYPAFMKIFTEEERKEKARKQKLEILVSRLNSHKKTQQIEHVLGFLTLVGGGGLVYSSEVSRNNQSSDEYLSDIQSLAGLISVMLGAALVAAAAGHSEKIKALEQEKHELTIREEMKSHYGGLRLTLRY